MQRHTLFPFLQNARLHKIREFEANFFIKSAAKMKWKHQVKMTPPGTSVINRNRQNNKNENLLKLSENEWAITRMAASEWITVPRPTVH
jgi:hypothetical protein